MLMIIGVLLVYGFVYHVHPTIKSHRMEKYFFGGQFEIDKTTAIKNGKEERMRYYNIANDHPLDGEYSQNYIEGLYAIIDAHGKVKVVNEIDGLRSPNLHWVLKHAMAYKK